MNQNERFLLSSNIAITMATENLFLTLVMCLVCCISLVSSCAPMTCQTKVCAPVHAGNCPWKVISGGGPCGCCDTCVKFLRKYDQHDWKLRIKNTSKHEETSTTPNCIRPKVTGGFSNKGPIFPPNAQNRFFIISIVLGKNYTKMKGHMPWLYQ